MDEQSKEDIKIKLKIKKYLELENVSFLTGAGTSWHLGAPLIRDIRGDLKQLCQKDIKTYFGKGKDPSYEDLLNCLQADRFIKDKKGKDIKSINESIKNMQNWLFDNCNTDNTQLNVKDDEKLNSNRYHYHEAFIKKILQRPSNLRRINLFTTNYDMAFDYALDNLCIHYINGFMGVHNRFFRPDIYDYDLYYPGESVQGKVYRAEKVIKYYKLHGSLSWLSTKPDFSNTYGIKEIPLNEEIKREINAGNELMIYPCVSKKSFALDLPYSELFRQFSQAISKPQSVLFCLGYSFYDEHINDIINQALSIPSFTLFIINYADKVESSSPIEKLKALGDSRIIVLDQTDKEQSAFIGFVQHVLPDLYEEEEQQSIIETMKKLYPDENSTLGPAF